MAGFLGRLQDLLTGQNPLGNVGIGLLSAPHGASFGQALGHGIEFASERQRNAMQNDFMRERLLQQAQDRRASAAFQDFIGKRLKGAPGIDPLQAEFAQRLAAVDPAAASNLLTQPGGLLNFGTVQEFESPTGKLIADLERAKAAGDTQAVAALEAEIARAQQSSSQEKFVAFENALGRSATEDEIVDFFGAGGTVVNVGTDESNKPIPPSQLDTIRLPDGSTPPLGTTFGQAAEAGARVFSAADLAKKEKLTTALGIVGDLKELAVGDEGVFVGVPDNILGRAIEGAGNIFGDLAGTDASINRTLYRSMSQGTLAPLVRSMGESGSLATEDVTRALKLLADLEGVPESESVARGKFAQLEEIFNRGLARFNATTGGGGNVVTFEDGTTVEFH